MGKLLIELVPETAFFKNVRSEVSKERWGELRKACYRAAGYVCEICGGKGPKWPVECHEVWEYDDDQKTQILLRLIALCPSCHQVKHFGLSRIRGLQNECIDHIMSVNSWSLEQAKDHIAEAFRIWRERSQHQWKLDISFLEEGK